MPSTEPKFVFGSRDKLVHLKENGFNVEGVRVVWICDSGDEDNEALSYMEQAKAINRPGSICACDYVPDPSGIGIVITLWYQSHPL